MASKIGFSPAAGLAAIAKAFSHGSETGADIETLKLLAIFCGLGLAISLLLLVPALDMGAEYF
jgi:hypothetical protein